jgi:chromate transporter
MIYWNLFYVFFTIGLFTFGGGYAMIPLITSEVVSRGWMTEDAIIKFIAVSESTPGPFAINIATYIGSIQGGWLGSIVASFAVILPSFIVILLVAALFKTFSKNRYVQAVLNGIRPVTIGLIAATAILIATKNIWTNFPETNALILSRSALVLLFDVGTLFIGYKKVHGKSMHPILLIVLSAILGIIVYAV